MSARTGEILEANARDLEAGRESGLSAALMDRLALDERRVEAMATGVREIVALPDPVGEVLDGFRLPNGLDVRKVRVPLGVVAVIYEARPNVTIDAAALALKSGNAIVLRGSSSATHSNAALAAVAAEAAEAAGLPAGSFCRGGRRPRGAGRAGHAGGRRRPDHPARRRGPEGGAERGGQGARHLRGVGQLPRLRGRVSRPGLRPRDHRQRQGPAARRLQRGRDAARALRGGGAFLPAAFESLRDAGVELRGDERARAVDGSLGEATEEDWATEYLALVLAVRVVDSADEAIEHIDTYGSGHSEAIVTGSASAARQFQHAVDAACVYVNASTRFTDGGQLGIGAEIGNSTQKLHARGPSACASCAPSSTSSRATARSTVVKVGLLGGTFNPPHIGHLVCAQEGLAQLELDRVLLVPVHEPPHKGMEADPGVDHRVELCRRAVAGDERLEVSLVDAEIDGPLLHGRYPAKAA